MRLLSGPKNIETIGKPTCKIVQKSREVHASVWNAAFGDDARINCCRQIEIRSVADLMTGVKILTRNVYFDGGDVLRCHQGRFRFVVDGDKAIEIGKGEVLCIYPGHRVTIMALEKNSRLIYCILNGDGVVDYLDGLGFYDGLKGKCNSQIET